MDLHDIMSKRKRKGKSGFCKNKACHIMINLLHSIISLSISWKKVNSAQKFVLFTHGCSNLTEVVKLKKFLLEQFSTDKYLFKLLGLMVATNIKMLTMGVHNIKTCLTREIKYYFKPNIMKFEPKVYHQLCPYYFRSNRSI